MLEKGFTWLSHHDGVVRELLPNCSDKLHKVLGVSIGHIKADVFNEWNGFQNAAQFVQVSLATARTGCNMLRTRVKML